jgi:hypothetical protein
MRVMDGGKSVVKSGAKSSVKNGAKKEQSLPYLVTIIGSAYQFGELIHQSCISDWCIS